MTTIDHLDFQPMCEMPDHWLSTSRSLPVSVLVLNTHECVQVRGDGALLACVVCGTRWEQYIVVRCRKCRSYYSARESVTVAEIPPTETLP